MRPTGSCARRRGHKNPGAYLKGTTSKRTTHFAGRSILVDVHRRRTDHATTKARSGRARLDDRELDAKRRYFLCDRLDEAFNGPFARVIQAEIRIGGLSTLGRDLHDPPATLSPQVREGGADDLD